jgi:putative acetyltransferase
MVQIRLVHETDLPALATLYRETVLVNAPQYYTPAQTAMWASFGQMGPDFQQFILGVTTYVAADDRGLVGFAGLGLDGHVASAYVRHDCLSQGIGSALMATVLEQAQVQRMQRLYGEASEFSLGLFQAFDFRLYDTEVVNRDGVQFKRYLMERMLS